MTRRDFVAGALPTATMMAGTGPIATSPFKPATYVMVHGSWHGGWCWNAVSARLQAWGHRVFAPTLTGLGERFHRRSPNVGLETHIEDVIALLEREDLRDVIIVAHSYSGFVVSGVCDRVRSRIRHSVFIDAPAPRDGDRNAIAFTREQIEGIFGPFIEGYMIPVPDPAMLGIKPSDHANFSLLKERLTPHPVKTWFDPIHLVRGGSEGLARTYVACSEAAPGSALARLAVERRADPSWHYREIPSGHDAMLIRPVETAEVLLELA